MHDVYLRFTSHDDALAALASAGLAIPPNDDGEPRISYHDTGLPAGMLIVKAVGAACNGQVYEPTGTATVDDDGTLVSAMAPVDGFHVNIRMAEGKTVAAALLPFLVTPLPATPAEIFA